MSPSFVRFSRWFFPAVWALLALPAQGAPVDVGNRLELFVDKLLIDELRGANLKMSGPRSRKGDGRNWTTFKR